MTIFKTWTQLQQLQFQSNPAEFQTDQTLSPATRSYILQTGLVLHPHPGRPPGVGDESESSLAYDILQVDSFHLGQHEGRVDAPEYQWSRPGAAGHHSSTHAGHGMDCLLLWLGAQSPLLPLPSISSGDESQKQVTSSCQTSPKK